MKSVLIVGIGRFGRHLAKKFVELGNEVMIVDNDEEKISELIPIVTTAQIGDCTNEEVLRSLGVRNFDICFVCIGNNFQSSLEVTSLLKELGAKHVISKANREIHAKFLLRNGADEVVYPEKDLAEKTATKYSANNVFDYIELTDEYSIFEIPPMKSWIGKTIVETSIRSKYQLTILAIKRDNEILPAPSINHICVENEHLIVMGKKEHVMKIINKI